jgi:hypothetical protein
MMKIVNLLSFRNHNGLIILITFFLSIPAYSQEKTESVRLKYKYSTETPVKYLTTSNVVQDIDINGQSMQINVLSLLGCRVKSTGLSDNNLRLEITIDTMSQVIDSPQGSSGGALSEAIGKVFTIAISQEGKEIDLSGAEQIVYGTGDGSTSNAGQSFNDFFPDVPSEPITPGFTWTTTDSLNSKTSTMTVRMSITSENKFEGFEQINGINCARISSILKGTREMKTRTQGMDIKIIGPFTGTSDLYFAPEEGYFLKQSVKTMMPGTMEMTSPESMTFNLVMNATSVNEVQK